jgi:hypothetical protein
MIESIGKDSFAAELTLWIAFEALDLTYHGLYRPWQCQDLLKKLHGYQFGSVEGREEHMWSSRCVKIGFIPRHNDSQGTSRTRYLSFSAETSIDAYTEAS